MHSTSKTRSESECQLQRRRLTLCWEHAGGGRGPAMHACVCGASLTVCAPCVCCCAQVPLAMGTLLGFVLPRVPNSVLRSKFAGCCAVLTALLERHSQNAPVAKAMLLCLSQVMHTSHLVIASHTNMCPFTCSCVQRPWITYSTLAAAACRCWRLRTQRHGRPPCRLS